MIKMTIILSGIERGYWPLTGQQASGVPRSACFREKTICCSVNHDFSQAQSPPGEVNIMPEFCFWMEQEFGPRSWWRPHVSRDLLKPQWWRILVRRFWPEPLIHRPGVRRYLITHPVLSRCQKYLKDKRYRQYLSVHSDPTNDNWQWLFFHYRSIRQYWYFHHLF